MQMTKMPEPYHYLNNCLNIQV